MTYIIKWWDPTAKDYKEVATDQPLPVTTVGSGAGGSEKVQITSTGGDTTTGAYGSEAITNVGLDTNARVMGVNGANALPVSASNLTVDGADPASVGLLTNGRLMGFNGTGWDRLQVDASKNLLVKENSPSSLTANVLSVTTAGTRVQLPNIACKEVTIIAKRTNTGSIYAGGNTVSSSVYGVELQAKDSFTFKVNNANLIYIDSSVSGEGISYVAV